MGVCKVCLVGSHIVVCDNRTKSGPGRGMAWCMHNDNGEMTKKAKAGGTHPPTPPSRLALAINAKTITPHTRAPGRL